MINSRNWVDSAQDRDRGLADKGSNHSRGLAIIMNNMNWNDSAQDSDKGV